MNRIDEILKRLHGLGEESEGIKRHYLPESEKVRMALEEYENLWVYDRVTCQGYTKDAFIANYVAHTSYGNVIKGKSGISYPYKDCGEVTRARRKDVRCIIESIIAFN